MILLWNQLGVLINDNEWNVQCVNEYFNAIRSNEERRSRVFVDRFEGFTHFNQFIEDNCLVDLSMCGRRFTWYQGDGISMSHLDRFLLSDTWVSLWSNCIQVALCCTISDHCLILMTIDEENQGPRPVRILKYWADLPGYKKFVKDQWLSFQVDSWGGFVMKDKLKLIKGGLKLWHQNHTRNLEGKIEAVKDRISFMDVKGDAQDLAEEELREMHYLSS